MRYRAAMFDLDGTLADTLADIAAAANSALQDLGRPTHRVEDYRGMVGNGVVRLAERAVGPGHGHLTDEAVRRIEAYFATHGHARTRPYPDVPGLLYGLADRGMKLAVFSNKPDAAARGTVERVFPHHRFHAVRGHREGEPLKPDPAGALSICRELDIPPEAWVYIGDSGVDMQTAVSAGMYPVGVAWGFRDEAELREHGAATVIRRPAELTELVTRGPKPSAS